MTDGPVLIVRVGAMGDVLHALPAIAALRALRPERQIDWVADPRWAPLLTDEDGHGPVVSRVHLADTRLWSRAPVSRATLRSVLALRNALRAAPYHCVIDMQGTLRSAVIGSFARAPLFGGYADPRETAAKWLYSECVDRRGRHVVEQGAALVGELCGTPLAPVPAALPHVAWADEWAQNLAAGDRLCVLAASAGWGAKQWPVERYAELAQALRQRGFRVLTNAPRKDNEIAAAVVEASSGAAELVVCNVAGLVALLRCATVVVGGDSGPVHLAAALGVPVVALFGPTDPARNGPWGPGPVRVLRHGASATSYKRQQETEAGLARITAAEVLDAVEHVLGAGGPPPV